MPVTVFKARFSCADFRLSGPVSQELNAGNAFYGEDLALWLCQTLSDWQLTALDEDWGWLVASRRQSEALSERHSICIYAYPEAPVSEGQWLLLLQSETQRPWLLGLKRWRPEAFTPRLAADLAAALQGLKPACLHLSVCDTDAAGREQQERPYLI